MSVPSRPVELLIAHAEQDQLLCERLEKHLGVLKQEGLALVWTERSISIGDDWQEEVSDQIKNAEIILVLLSADFFASKYWLGSDMEQALLRHRKEAAIVLPVVARPCMLPREFAEGQLLPPGGRPLTTWTDVDEGLKLVVERVRESILRLRRRAEGAEASRSIPKARDAKLILREEIDSLVELQVARERLIHEGDPAGAAQVRQLVEDLAQRTRPMFRFEHGDTVAGARLISPIGSGAFATVWAGDHDGKVVAVKIFHPQKLAEGAMLWRFRRGIRAIQYLTVRQDANPTIVPILQVDDTGVAFSMPHCSRGNLENIASRQWSIEKKIGTVVKVSRALEAAHALGVLHRDIKPANIVIDDQEEARLTDFDIADVQSMLTETYIAGGIGTPAFAAPEQLDSGQAADARADVYSLGRLLHYLLSERPLGVRSKEHLDLKDLSSFPRSLVSVVRKATEHAPEDRYPTVEAFRRALERRASRMSTIGALVDVFVRPARQNGGILFLVFLVVALVFALGAREYRVSREAEAIQEEIDRQEAEIEDLWQDYLRSTDPFQDGLTLRKALDLQNAVDKNQIKLNHTVPLLLPRPRGATPPPVASPGSTVPSRTGYFQRGQAMAKMGIAAQNARNCWLASDYAGTVTVTMSFANDGSVHGIVSGNPPLTIEARRCVELKFGAFQVEPFTSPAKPVDATKSFRVGPQKSTPTPTPPPNIAPEAR